MMECTCFYRVEGNFVGAHSFCDITIAHSTIAHTKILTQQSSLFINSLFAAYPITLRIYVNIRFVVLLKLVLYQASKI